MKTLVVVFGLLAWIGSCSEESDINEAVTVEADAVWMNQLAADGCSWHFSIESGDSTLNIVPTDGSIKKIENAVGKIEDAYSSTNVHLKYSLTGKKKDVECGWGSKASFDEVTVYEIYKK